MPSTVTMQTRTVDVAHPLLVAEVASAHEGRLEEARALVRAVAEAGVEAIKFQLVIADELVTRAHPNAELFRGIELDRRSWQQVVEDATRRRLVVMADVFGARSLELAQSLGIELLKIPSTSFTDPELVPRVAALGQPTLLSTAGATEEEIDWVVNEFRRHRHPAFVLMHGFQGFPTPLAATHLSRVRWLRQRFGVPVGLSDHVPAESALARVVPLMALGEGIVVVEKHVTRDRSRRGLDWVSSLEPQELQWLQEALRQSPTAFGPINGAWMEGEPAYRRTMRRHLVAAGALAAGEVVTAGKVSARRTSETEDGIDAWFLNRGVVGKKLLRPLAAGEGLRWELFAEPRVAVLIAVRMKSARLPRKALADLAGRTVIDRLVERMQAVTRAQHVVLCTSTHADDQPLVETAQRVGIPWVRGAEEDVMARFLQAAAQVNADVVVRVTGDNPLTDAPTIDRMIESHLAHDAEYTYTEDLPFGTRAEVISAPALRRMHAAAEDPTQTEYMTLYLKQPGAMRQHRYAVEDPALVRPHYRLTLDTPEDLAVLRTVYQRLAAHGSCVPLQEVIRLLDASPELVRMNAAVEQRKLDGRINTRLRASGVLADAVSG